MRKRLVWIACKCLVLALTFTLVCSSLPLSHAALELPASVSHLDDLVLLEDDFNDGNADGWTEVSGDWEVINREYVIVTSNNPLDAISVSGGPDWCDYEYQADVMGTAGVDKLIIFRYVDVNNFYSVNVRSGNLQDMHLGRRVKGMYTDLAHVSFPNQPNVWYRLKATLEGDHIQVYADGHLYIDYTDVGTPLTCGLIGLEAISGADIHFDNVLVLSTAAPILSPIENPDGDDDYLVAWSTVVGAATYTLEEDDQDSFPSPTVRYSGDETSFHVSNQQPGGWYYRVRASNAGGDSPWSNVEVAWVAPQTAPTLFPIANGDGDGTYVADWSQVNGATTYELQEDDNAEFTTPTVRYAGSNTQYQVTGQQGGTWYYRVRASNTGGNSPWSATQSTIVIPAAPTLLSISNPDGDGTYLVDWSDAVGATTYELQEDDNSGFTSPTYRYSGSDTQYQMNGQQSGTWYYRVRAGNGAGTSPWSNTELVSVLPAALELLPISNPELGADYLVDWNDVTGATGYELQEDDNSGFSSPAYRYSGPDTQYGIVGQPGGTWYYRVRGTNLGGEGPWSNTQSVVVDGTPPASTATSPTYDSAQPIPVSWTASDADPSSGLYQTCLWYKLSSAGAWTLTAGCQSGSSGTFDFVPPGGIDGVYYFQSIAEDNAGNVEPGPSGNGDDSTIFDTTPPASAADSPEQSRLGETILVTWQASDALSGLQETCLWYRLAESGPWTATGTCQPGPSGTFLFHPLDGCGTYYFQSIASDNAGNVEAGPADPGDSQTLVRAYLYLPLTLRAYRSPLVVNGGFESASFVGWAHGGALPQSISTFQPHTGLYTTLLGQATPQQPYPPSSAWATQEVAIPSECTAAPLRFWYRIFTNDVEDWSSFHAIVIDSGGVDHEILRDGYPGAVAPAPGTDLGWRNFTYDLAGYAGQTIRVRFESANEHNGALGIWTYLDDVTLNCSP